MRDVSPAGIGGFIGLDDPSREPAAAGRDGRWPFGGVPHSTGRAALRAILETVRPTLVHLPSYICRVILEPLRSSATPWRRYPTAGDLTHGELPEVGDGELLIVVDHFGLQVDEIRALAVRLGDRLVVDATQSLFAEPAAGAWSFTSARKFLGLPDGAAAHGPRPVAPPDAPPADVGMAHLELRADGRLDAARAAFLDHERALDDRRRPPSEATRRRLEVLDLARVARRRRENFTAVHARLGRHNALAVSLPASGAPHAYPFLGRTELDRAALHRRRIFVPTFWPEMPEGTGPGDTSGVEPTAATLARRLLPLPVDQRYGAEEMAIVGDAVLELVRP